MCTAFETLQHSLLRTSSRSLHARTFSFRVSLFEVLCQPFTKAEQQGSLLKVPLTDA